MKSNMQVFSCDCNLSNGSLFCSSHLHYHSQCCPIGIPWQWSSHQTTYLLGGLVYFCILCLWELPRAVFWISFCCHLWSIRSFFYLSFVKFELFLVGFIFKLVFSLAFSAWFEALLQCRKLSIKIRFERLHDGLSIALWKLWQFKNHR